MTLHEIRSTNRDYSADKETEELMHHLIREEFKGSTVIAIAHRLETLVDFDRILVLDSAVIVESGSFSELLSRPGRFRDLYEA